MKHLAAFLLAFGIAYLFANAGNMVSAAAPPRPDQPHTDQFMYNGASLAIYNAMGLKAQSQRTVSYRLLTMPGCNAGIIPSAMQRVEQEASTKLHFALVRNDSAYDFTVRINCGSDQIRLCGAVTTFCLGRGYPYNDDVELSDILSTYQYDTQLAVPLHEIVGHALATWNEQYCTGGETTGVCRGLAQFTPAPNWHDFMNTGPESRHGLEAIELERWERTMYALTADCQAVGFDPCTGRWYQADGWSWEPSTGNWWSPEGKAEWTPCNGDGIRFNLQLGFWSPPGSGIFVPSRGYWSFSPAC